MHVIFSAGVLALRLHSQMPPHSVPTMNFCGCPRRMPHKRTDSTVNERTDYSATQSLENASSGCNLSFSSCRLKNNSHLARGAPSGQNMKEVIELFFLSSFFHFSLSFSPSHFPSTSFPYSSRYITISVYNPSPYITHHRGQLSLLSLRSTIDM